MSLAEELDSVDAATAGTVDRHATTETSNSTAPASGAMAGVFPVHDTGAVEGFAARARTAVAQWAALGWDGRKQRFSAYRGHLARRMHELSDLVHRENGKPHADAILQITLAVDHLAWAAVPDAFQVVTRFGGTGTALCPSRVDEVAFTGSAATGRKVMATCAETLTPVLLELGGKDAMIDDDADVVAAVWGAMSNGGQTCIGIERVHATDAVHDRFVADVTAQVRALRPGADDEATYGPTTMPSQIDVVRRHVDGAAASGPAWSPAAPTPTPPRPRATSPHRAARRARGLRRSAGGGPSAPRSPSPGCATPRRLERADATSNGLAGAVFSRSSFGRHK